MIFFLPLAYLAMAVFVLPLPIPAWVVPILLLCITAVGFFQKEIFLKVGRLGFRKRWELAFCAQLALLTLREFHPALGFWPAIPYFLFLVWAEMTVLQLASLTLSFVFLSAFVLKATLSLDQHLVLVLVVLGGVLFRASERRKKSVLEKKLENFETFERKVTQQNGAFAIDTESNDLQSRSDIKIGELVRRQIQRFTDFAQLMNQLFKAHSVLIYRFDPLKDQFHLQSFQSQSDQIDTSIQNLEGIFMAVRAKGIACFVSKGEIRQLPYYTKVPPVACAIAIPVKHQSLLVGAIILDRLQGAFSKDEIASLEKFAASIGDFMKDFETIYSYFRLKEELASFYAASSALNQAFHLQNVFEVFLKKAQDIAPFDLAFVIMWDTTTKYNLIVCQRGSAVSLVGEQFALAPSKGLVSWAISNGKPLFYDNYRERQRLSPIFHRRLKLPNIYDSVCIYPLVSKEAMLGAVVFMSEKNGFFNASTRKILEVLSMQASVAIKNAKMVRDLETLATTDGLTGLLNHRTFQRQLSNELERARRSGDSVSLILVDLDHFKKINDDYGHPMGDFVLKEVANFLQKSVRTVDHVARYGGEEFAIILPNTSGKEAFTMAKRMVEAIPKQKITENGITLRITFSVGIASFPMDALTKEQLIDFADEALYYSKKTGRNRASYYSADQKVADVPLKETRLIQRAEKILREQ